MDKTVTTDLDQANLRIDKLFAIVKEHQKALDLASDALVKLVNTFNVLAENNVTN